MSDENKTPPLRVFGEDGALHFSHLKKLAMSPRQYLAAVNEDFSPTRNMLIGTIVHHLVLGPRKAQKPLVKFSGEARRGKTWDEFLLAHPNAEIATATEWREAEPIAEAILADPLVRARFDGAEFETPMVWEDGGIKCSTDGIDILVAAAVGDLKTTPSVHPETFQRQAIRMLYPQQMAFYRRAARANGRDVSRGLFILGAETRVPYECIDLELTEAMIDFADRSISLWLERLRVLLDACPEPTSYLEWPGYTQSTIAFDIPPWEQADDDEDGEEVAA